MLELLITVFLVAPIAFCILFIVFLVRSIKRGKRIRELELEVARLRAGNTDGAAPSQGAVFVPLQPSINADGQTEYIRLPEIGATDNMPQQPAAISQTQAYAPQYTTTPQYTAAPQMPVYTPQPAVQEDIPGQAPTPSWAVSPESAQAKRVQQMYENTQPAAQKPQREKFFSSINITFGIGVLLLTIVGATFMTGSWPWMTEGFRAAALIAIVVLVYGMSFFAGKVLKLKQTEFALYSLASLLGPIVIVGMGAFNLLGSAFSFKDGTGWLVAIVAALVLVVTSVGGRFIFKEDRTQSNIYSATFYIAVTWLVIFLSAQIGQASEVVNEWSMICLGLATMALVFRIVALTKLLEDEVFFNVYSEIITYIPAVLLLFTAAFSDGAVFGATIIEFAAFVLFARFGKGRQWAKYLTPFVGMKIVYSWFVFGAEEEMILTGSVLMAIIFILYVIHKLTGISTWLSDIGLAVALAGITTVTVFEDAPVIGVIACILTLMMLIFQLLIEPRLAENEELPEWLFRKTVSPVMQVVLSVLSALSYYMGIVMIYSSVDNMPFNGHLFFTLSALIPVIAAIVFRIIRNDDLRVKSAGVVLSVISLIAGLVSCFQFVVPSHELHIWYMHTGICSALLTLAVIAMAVFFMIKPLKEKILSGSVMFWISVCLNSLAIVVFMTLGFLSENVWAASNLSEEKEAMIWQAASLSFVILNSAAFVAAYFLKRKGKEFVSKYSAGIKYFFAGFAMGWFILSWILIGTNWKLLIAAVLFAVILSVFDLQIFSVLPVIAAEFSLIGEIDGIQNENVCNALLIGSVIAIAGVGRLLFRKNVFSKTRIDYLSLTSVLMLLGVFEADYVPMMVFLALALVVLNFAGRIKLNPRIPISGFAALMCMALVFQPFVDYPDVISLEINLILILGTLLLICRVIKPFSVNVMKYLWFTGVALSIVAEGVSAGITGEVLDLIVVGTASFGIFIYAFIRRNRLWFILGIVSMISIAVYLSVAFWSSLVWLIYLLIAGIILVVMASVNEWGKRHNKDGKKRRFFEEWTW